LAAAGLLVVDRIGRGVVAAVVALAVLAGLGGPAAYAVDTATTPHTGSIPSAGPAVAGGFGPGGGGFRARFGGNAAGGPPPARAFPGGGFRGTGGFPGTGGNGTPGGFFGGLGGFRGGLRGAGGLLDAAKVSSALAKALSEDATSYRWVAAAVGSNNAAGYQLATQLPVMPLGGFNGSDPSPTLAQFEQYVRAGEIHWFIASGGIGGRSQGGSDAASQIASWVEAHYSSTTVGGVTLYDLTRPSS
jgi:hypothetical protein